MLLLCAVDIPLARSSFSSLVSSSHSSGRRLPPLNALRAFEACARLGSTVAAAAELGVTHGAISKQVSLLERWLGVPLFERGGGRLVPTPESARYAAALASALDLVERSTEVLRATGTDLPRLVRLTTTGPGTPASRCGSARAASSCPSAAPADPSSRSGSAEGPGRGSVLSP